MCEKISKGDKWQGLLMLHYHTWELEQYGGQCPIREKNTFGENLVGMICASFI